MGLARPFNSAELHLKCTGPPFGDFQSVFPVPWLEKLVQSIQANLWVREFDHSLSWDLEVNNQQLNPLEMFFFDKSMSSAWQRCWTDTEGISSGIAVKWGRLTGKDANTQLTGVKTWHILHSICFVFIALTGCSRLCSFFFSSSEVAHNFWYYCTLQPCASNFCRGVSSVPVFCAMVLFPRAQHWGQSCSISLLMILTRGLRVPLASLQMATSWTGMVILEGRKALLRNLERLDWWLKASVGSIGWSAESCTWFRRIP